MKKLKRIISYYVICTSDVKQGQYGVVFITRGELRSSIIQFRPINERVAYLRVDIKSFNLSILNVYAPTETATEDERDKLYEKLEVPQEDTILVLGDFNAQIGKENHIKQVTGKQTIHERTNDNGQRLCSLAVRTNMIISSTKFKQIKKHTYK